MQTLSRIMDNFETWRSIIGISPGLSRSGILHVWHPKLQRTADLWHLHRAGRAAGGGFEAPRRRLGCGMGISWGPLGVVVSFCVGMCYMTIEINPPQDGIMWDNCYSCGMLQPFPWILPARTILLNFWWVELCRNGRKHETWTYWMIAGKDRSGTNQNSLRYSGGRRYTKTCNGLQSCKARARFLLHAPMFGSTQTCSKVL